MAPKGAKRTNSGPASPKKKSRVDPVFAGIIATLEGADDLSERCREMLIAMVNPSLSTFKSERHNLQQMGVEMIEEKLEHHKQKLAEDVAKAKKAVEELEGSKSGLSAKSESAKAVLEEKKTAFLSAHTASQEAKAAVKEAESALAEAKSLQKKGDANHASLEKQKVAIEAAYEEHFKTPMDANEGPHHSDLKLFIEDLGLEASLTTALPTACVKSKEQRGSFDELVITELGKALLKKIADLGQSIADEVSGVEERKSAISAAEAALEAKTLAEKTAAADAQAAATAKHEADAELNKASEEWATFEPRVLEAAEKLSANEAALADFEEGALKDFVNLRDKEAPAPVEEEAAPAGA